MFEKGSRFYADWRDKRGTRHRRAFPTAEEATAYEAEQKQRHHPKPKGPAPRSPRSSGPTSKRGPQPAKVKIATNTPCSTSGPHSSRRPAAKRRKT